VYLLASAALAAPLDLALLLDTDRLDGAGADALCLKGPGRNSATRAAVEIPVGRPTEALTFRWAADRPNAGGPAAQLTLTYADGRVVSFRAELGEAVGITASNEGIPVVVGMHDGTPVVATEWSVATGRPDVPVTSLRIAARSSGLCIFSLDTVPYPGTGVQRTDTSTWYPYDVAPLLDAPIPQAAPVEAPAGRHGKVELGPDGRLRFADGTPARFWGIDIYRAAALPAKEDADAFAATIAAWGFNMVRLHHIDDPGVGLVNPRRGEPGQPTLDPATLDRLDFFLARLKAHGVYFFLETATLRQLTAADGVGEPGGAPLGHKLVPMWRPEWLDAHLRWFETLWGRTNPYTGVRFADDPQVALVELTNEHSLLMFWGPGLEALPSAHLQALDARWNSWLKQRYADDAALRAAWTDAPRAGLQTGESLATGTVRRDPQSPGFFPAWPTRRIEDLYDFYASLEVAYFDALASKARALGFTVPIDPTLAYEQPEVAVLRQPYPLGDTHFEWDFASGDRLRAESALANPRSQQLLAQAVRAVEGKAMSISEVNHPFPNPYMAEGPLLWATYASLQGWDIVLWNDYVPLRTSDGSLEDVFDVRGAPVKIVQMASASSAFRTGAIPEAPGRFYLNHSPEAVRRSAGTGRAELPELLSDVAFFLSNRIRTTFDPAPRANKPGTPATGVGWWSDPGLLVLDQPTLQARVGPPLVGSPTVGAGPAAPSRLDVQLQDWAAVTLATVDGKPLAQSRRALLTVGTREESTGMAWQDHGRQVRAWGVGPQLVAPARGIVRFAWTGTPRVRALQPDGSPGPELPATADGKGWWKLDLTAAKSPWFLVETR
jgi:hypothetical protein